MVKTQEFFSSMIENYSATDKPPVAVKSVGSRSSETYSLDYQAGMIQLAADNPFGALFGYKKAQGALRSGFIRENLGKHTPRFPLRAFHGALDEIPAALQLGYNAVVCQKHENLDVYREYGLKIILKVSEQGELPPVDYIWVQSRLDLMDEMTTKKEAIEGDMGCWEEWAGGKAGLIYQLIHGSEEQWVKLFLNCAMKAKKGTLLAFSSAAPDLFWIRLRQLLHPVVTPLFVICDQNRDISEKCRSHNFFGGATFNTEDAFFLN